MSYCSNPGIKDIKVIRNLEQILDDSEKTIILDKNINKYLL